ncbi:MAG: YggT family protein [Rhizomicrobium sp.]|jgi:YggT family protein
MFGPLIDVFLLFFNTVVGFYEIIVIAAVVVSWLIAFGILNTYNHMARSLVNLLDTLTDPVFRRIRRVIPPLGGLDLSPLIVLLLLQALQILVNDYVRMLA